MRVKDIRLKNYKRFTDLSIAKISQDVRLVVLIGPNGSGKSSVLDAFLAKSRNAGTNYFLQDTGVSYYLKSPGPPSRRPTSSQLVQDIQITFHSFNPTDADWKSIFNIRSSYRNESDFRVDSISLGTHPSGKPRFDKIIDVDQSVSHNYSRLIRTRAEDLEFRTPPQTTFGQYRATSLQPLQEALAALFSDPALSLGPISDTLKHGGTFTFTKGAAIDFLYKNLSGGEKAAFDILLDLFVSRDEYKDAIYAVDEPETHVATALHGPLLNAMLSIIPEESQLWIATHSIGFVRAAYDIMRSNNAVSFIDFSDQDFDKPVALVPTVQSRAFWRNVYTVALDDIAALIAPRVVVLCEGNREQPVKGFDSKCYNRLFQDSYPDALFVSHGGCEEVLSSEALVTVMKAMSPGTRVTRLIDRDTMTDGRREELLQSGTRVLRRREIENYLLDSAVIEEFLKTIGQQETAREILAERARLLGDASDQTGDIKTIGRELFAFVRKTVGHDKLGNRPDEFFVEHLVPALRRTPSVFQELETDIFQQADGHTPC